MTPPIRTVDALLTGARIYGESNEPYQEADVLSALLVEAWGHLTEEQKEKVYCSEAAVFPCEEMGYHDYKLSWVDPETNEFHPLGWMRLLPTQEVSGILMDNYWDNRLDATDCQPVVHQYELGWADEEDSDE